MSLQEIPCSCQGEGCWIPSHLRNRSFTHASPPMDVPPCYSKHAACTQVGSTLRLEEWRDGLAGGCHGKDARRYSPCEERCKPWTTTDRSDVCRGTACVARHRRACLFTTLGRCSHLAPAIAHRSHAVEASGLI